jgi:hypothetical protein
MILWFIVLVNLIMVLVSSFLMMKWNGGAKRPLCLLLGLLWPVTLPLIILGKRYRIHRKISQEVVGNERNEK